MPKPKSQPKPAPLDLAQCVTIQQITDHMISAECVKFKEDFIKMLNAMISRVGGCVYCAHGSEARLMDGLYFHQDLDRMALCCAPHGKKEL